MAEQKLNEVSTTAPDTEQVTAPTKPKKMATLVNPQGQRVAVEVDSQDAQKRFSEGYVLEGAPGGPQAPRGIPATLIHPDTGEKRVVDTGSPEAQKGFDEGMILMGSDEKPVGTPGSTTAPPTAPTSTTEPTDVAEPVDTTEEVDQPVTDYATALKETTAAGVETKKNELLSAPESFDRSISEQKAALWAAINGQDLTPDDLKWLTPAQSKAVLTDGPDGERLMRAELSGLASLQTDRRTQKKEAEDAALRKYDIFAESGTPLDQLPEGFLAGLDKSIGLPEGTFAAVYASDFAENEQEKVDAALDAKIKIGQYLDTVELGESVTINGITYMGRSTDGIEIGADGHGRRFKTMPDGSIAVQDLGMISPPGKTSELFVDADNVAWNDTVDPITGKHTFTRVASGFGQGTTASTGDAGFEWDQAMPDGTFFGGEDFIDPATGKPFTTAKEGECGVFARWASDGSIRVGNSWESKQAITDSSIGTDENPVRVGDFFVQDIGTYGHIGIINSIDTDPNGDIVYTLTEANIKNDGKITHTREMKADSSTLTGFARSATGLRSEFDFGSDSGYYGPWQPSEIVTQEGESLGPNFGPGEGEVDFENMSAMDKLQIKSLSVDIFGKRAGTKPENVATVADLFALGMNMDQIKDELRFAGQSEAFSGAFRDAAENITIHGKYGEGQTERFFDSLDRNLEEGNHEEALDTMKIAALASMDGTEKKEVKGKDRTVEFLLEVQQDLIDFEAAGGDTGIFDNSKLKIANKVGRITDPELQKIGTKIKVAIQKYRHEMSGAAFSVAESKEYESIFPNIDKRFKYNKANIDALVETFEGDLNFAFSESMGPNAYTNIYGTGGMFTTDLQGEEEDTFNDYFDSLDFD